MCIYTAPSKPSNSSAERLLRFLADFLVRFCTSDCLFGVNSGPVFAVTGYLSLCTRKLIKST